MKRTMKRTVKSRGGKRIGRWARKGRKKQKGGFIGLIIAALVGIGVAAETAGTIAAVAAPIVTGALGAAGAAGVNAMVGKGKKRTVRRIIRRRFK